MNISDENTNELDSYGVWVKHSSSEENLSEVNEDKALDQTDDSLDLPDFDDTDFSDMFKDDSQFNSDLNDDFSNDDDTTLSADELANITSGDITLEETPEVGANAQEDTVTDESFEIPQDDSSTGDDIFNDNELNIEETSDFNFEESAEEPAATETEIELQTSDITEEINLDDFGFEETADTTEEPSAQEAETTSDQEEEISLDDFMDSGFSDESVASGNNGFEAGKGPDANATEEVSLDDFVDMSDFGVDSSSDAQKEEEIVEEEPLDMDISFDETADSVETEENISIEEEYEDEDISETPEVTTEEVSLDDFGADISNVSENVESDISTEDVDLSDFGIDADAEETPIVQDVEESKTKDAVVDYDLHVGNENTETAPIVNEIKSDEPAEVIDQAEEVTEVTQQPGTETVSTSLLQQIVADLSGLKDEINLLKSNLAELKANENTVPAPQAEINEEPIEDSFENTIEDQSENITDDSEISFEPEIQEEDDSNAGGFFGLDDTDDTIALSGDELNNIFNSAEFSEVTVEAPVNPEFEAETEDETVISEQPDTDNSNELPESIEEDFSNTVTDTEDVTSSLEESFIQETESDNDTLDLPSDIPFEESEQIEEEISTDTFDINENNENIDETIEETIGTELNSEEEISFDFENETLEEPNLDQELSVDEEIENEDLPDEISIPKSDDILVETKNADFMDSVKDSTEIEEDSTPVAEDIEDDVSFDSVDSFLEDNEPVVEETQVSEDEIAETSVSDFSEIDNLNNDLSDSNMDYLTTKDEIEESSSEPEVKDETVNSDLKKDIKSVLLYMDQLLENLPEDKIIEFAKSDEFSTYKKLFSELGLS